MFLISDREAFEGCWQSSDWMASEVEETLKRLVGHKGVIGTIVVNNEGVPIKSTLDNATTV